MNSDVELEIWRETWQSSHTKQKESSDFELCRSVKRKDLRLKALLILEFAWGLFLLGFSFMVARRFPVTEMFVWAGVVWLLTLAATGYSVWNWRFLWKSAPKSAAEYVRAYERHCLAGLRQVQFGYCFLTVGLAINVPWLSWKFFRSGPGVELSLTAYSISMALIAAFTAGYLLWFSISKKNRLHELEQLKQYKEVLDEEV
jgi:hypothetical protein